MVSELLENLSVLFIVWLSCRVVLLLILKDELTNVPEDGNTVVTMTW